MEVTKGYLLNRLKSIQELLYGGSETENIQANNDLVALIRHLEA